MNREFIPYEQALEIKELGFDEECFGYYFELRNPSEGILTIEKCKNNIDGCLAPTFSQVFRWFRNKHHIDVVIGATYDRGKTYYLRIETGPTWGYQYFDDKSITYEEAEIAVLKKMIEIVKNK